MKDSGQREQFESGMVRDTTEGKTDFALVLDGPMFKRWAVHLTKGAVKYAKRNWMQARGQAELDRFRESALRHFLQWFDGETDEDHAAAVYFNINGAEYVKEQMASAQGPTIQAPADALTGTAAMVVGGPGACPWITINQGDVKQCMLLRGHPGKHVFG